MILELNKWYKTRSGKKARIIATDRKSAQFSPLQTYVVLITSTDGAEYPRPCDAKGNVSSYHLSEDDLVSEWMEPLKISGWINIYEDIYQSRSHSRIYALKEDALSSRVAFLTYLALVYVSGEEGQEP